MFLSGKLPIASAATMFLMLPEVFCWLSARAWPSRAPSILKVSSRSTSDLRSASSVVVSPARTLAGKVRVR